jgi:hypothetical protein
VVEVKAKRLVAPKHSDVTRGAIADLMQSSKLRRYLDGLSRRIGAETTPAELRPYWDREPHPFSNSRIPGIRSVPDKEWSYWTLLFDTRWTSRPREAIFVVTAASGGHQLGRYGAVSWPIGEIVRVRVRAHLPDVTGGSEERVPLGRRSSSRR